MSNINIKGRSDGYFVDPLTFLGNTITQPNTSKFFN